VYLSTEVLTVIIWCFKYANILLPLLHENVPYTYELFLCSYIFILQVENLVAIELAYINTKHPDFHKDAALVSSLLKSVEEDERLQRPANRRHNPSHISQSLPLLGDTDKDAPKVGWIELNFRCIFSFSAGSLEFI
jgi:hypothetical protein